jgi:hypothetical protein
LEIIFEIIFQFFVEIFIQVFAEALFELGFYSLAEALNRKRRRNPFLASIGYLLWGGIIGVITIFFFPTLMIKNPTLRILNLFVSPIIAGFAMSAIGSLRRKRGQDTLRIDSFVYGALFAFGMAIIRFLYVIYLR